MLDTNRERTVGKWHGANVRGNDAYVVAAGEPLPQSSDELGVTLDGDHLGAGAGQARGDVSLAGAEVQHQVGGSDVAVPDQAIDDVCGGKEMDPGGIGAGV
jgi:hypothetical protein